MLKYIFILFYLLAFNSLAQEDVALVAANQSASAAGGGEITFDTASTPATEEFNVGISTSITIGNLTSGYIVFGLAYNDNLSVTKQTPTFDSGAMTLIASNRQSPSVVELWGLAVGTKAAGTYNIVCAVDDNNFRIVSYGAISFSGVHQVTSTGTAAGAGGSSTAPTVNVSSAVGEIVVGAVHSNDGGTITVGAEQTERWKSIGTTGGACSTEAGAGTVTTSYTKGSSSDWSVVGVPLKPAP